MKIAFIILAATMAFNVSAKSLSCTASLSSTKEDNLKFEQASEWMNANKVTDESLVPAEFLPTSVKVDTRTIKLDDEGNGSLAGIIIDSYEKHGISYNYAAWAENGFITYIGAENEVIHNGSGVKNLKGQTEVEFGSSSLEDESSLEVKCVIK